MDGVDDKKLSIDEFAVLKRWKEVFKDAEEFDPLPLFVRFKDSKALVFDKEKSDNISVTTSRFRKSGIIPIFSALPPDLITQVLGGGNKIKDASSLADALKDYLNGTSSFKLALQGSTYGARINPSLATHINILSSFFAGGTFTLYGDELALTAASEGPTMWWTPEPFGGFTANVTECKKKGICVKDDPESLTKNVKSQLAYGGKNNNLKAYRKMNKLKMKSEEEAMMWGTIQVDSTKNVLIARKKFSGAHSFFLVMNVAPADVDPSSSEGDEEISLSDDVGVECDEVEVVVDGGNFGHGEYDVGNILESGRRAVIEAGGILVLKCR